MLKKLMLIGAIIIGVLSVIALLSKFSKASIWSLVPWPVVICGIVAAALLYYFASKMSD